MNDTRSLGLFGATALGVGAIVGGGILALAGVAFDSAGPSAIVAFGLNGGIAFITATSFAQLARRFPESGGTYTYAKKVLSIEVAFVVGWVVWFASIVAGVLYALGFAAFAAEGANRLMGSGAPEWITQSGMRLAVATAAIGVYTVALVRKTTGGGNTATIGKIIVFAILIAGGAWAWIGAVPSEVVARLDPFATNGPAGIIRAMGYTFIALQGFDLIAAVGGEVRNPTRTIPRAMYLSLGIALTVYLPLLFLMSTVGAPDGGIAQAAASSPETLVAQASERFMGVAGYWLVIGAGILSMLSALQANLLGASRVAFAMARDRTLPRRLAKVRSTAGTPASAVLITAGMVVAIVLAIGDVAAAGAASSLIFLISFAMVHWAAVLARRRSGETRIGMLPFVGAALCLGLATFQAFAVREAGAVVAVWLAIGVALYLTLFAPGARLADVSAEARDPDLARLRGRRPLVLVPIANPASAASLVDLAATLRTPGVGRVLLLTVIQPSYRKKEGDTLTTAQRILGESLEYSLASALVNETMFTVAPDVWAEIGRVARVHACETVLVGMPGLANENDRLEGLIRTLDADVVVLRAPHRWHMQDAKRVLIPTAGRRDHSLLRARLLASLSRDGQRSLVFYRSIGVDEPPDAAQRAERELRALARDEATGPCEFVVERTDQPADAIVEAARDVDLVVLGMTREGRGQPALGGLSLAVARDTDVPLILIGRRRPNPLDPRRTP